MCNPDKIATILIGATVAIALALVFYLAVAVGGSSWWTSGGNAALMILAGVSVGVAIAVVGAALAEALKCQRAPCKTFGDRLVAALGTLLTSLTVLLAAGILAAFPSIIPGAGTAIGIAFSASAVVAGAALIYISVSVLPTLTACLGAASTAVVVQSVLGFFVGLVLAGLGASTFIGTTPFPFPPNPPVG